MERVGWDRKIPFLAPIDRIINENISDDDIELERRASDNEDDDEAESELFEKCRRERMEREAWLMENKKKARRDDDDDEGDDDDDDDCDS